MSLKYPMAALAAGAVLLAGCSSVEDQNKAESSGSAQATSAEAVAAQANVDKASAPIDSFTAPGDPLTGVDKLKGQTVYFVPANAQIPLFQGVKASLEQSLGNAGITVETCDGKANPANMASCIQQGIDAKAALSSPAALTSNWPRTPSKALRGLAFRW